MKKKGTVPPGYHVRPECVPQLSEDQAWTVLWYLQEGLRCLPDQIERCGDCGDLYDRGKTR